MKKFLCVAVLICVGVTLAFAGGQQSASIRTLVYGTTEKVTNMDPAEAYDFHTWEIFQNIYQGLLAYEPGTTELIPGLAESYSVNANGDEYTFKLRSGLKFTDGTPFTTDQGNFIIDCDFGPIADPAAIGAQLDARAGIVEHGLFLGLVSDVIVAGQDGIRHLIRDHGDA